MLTTAEFISKHNGKACDYDGVAGVQCVDLIKAFADEKFGISSKGKSWGNARDYWYNTPPELARITKKIKNTPDFIPKRSDICIFDDAQKKYGHICLGADGNNTTKTFYSYDQNYNGKKACTYTKHNFNRFLGVLRPIYLCTTANLNVRAGAGTNFEIVDTLDKGTLVKPLEYVNGWAKIGENKYCSAKYLD